MALNKYATIRYRVIDRCIRSKSHSFPSKEKLRQSCEEELYGSSTGIHISISTIEKDLWALKNESSLGYAPISYDKAYNGYYYTDKGFSLDLPLNEEDIELIRLATNTLKQFQDSEIFHDLEAAVGKIEGRLNVISHLEKPAQKEYIRFETAPHYAGSKYLSELLGAIRSKAELKVKYKPFTDSNQRKYTIHPLFLQEHKNRWYLVCFESDSDKYRTLGLDRISEIATTGSHFSEQDGFDPEIFYKHSFGIGIYSGKAEEVILSFESVQSKYIKAQPIHSTQKTIEESENCVIISLSVIISPEFLMHLMSYGPEVAIIKPESLKNKIVSLHQESVDKYAD